MPHFVFWSFAALVALAPLPLASNRYWAWSLLATCIGVLLISRAVATLRSNGGRRLALSWLLPAVVPFLMVLVWAYMQTSPWFADIALHPDWTAAAHSLGALSPHAAISLDPGASLSHLMRLLTYGGAFWIALVTCKDAHRARQLLWVIAASGTVYAIYGLIVQFTGSGSILWYRKWAYGDSITSTFVNRNSFATYLGFVMIAALALLASERERATPAAGAGSPHFVDTIDGLRGRAYCLMASLLIVGTALLLTESRAGILSALVGIAVFIFGLGIYHRRRHGNVAMFTGFALLVAVVLGSVSGQAVYDRLLSPATSLQYRSVVWDQTLEATQLRPLAGTGLGSFDDVFRSLRDARLPRYVPPFRQAHSTYVENALELGIPGFLLLTGAIAWLGIWCLNGVLTRRRHGIYPCAAIGALALAALHAGFDFSLQIPAVSIALMAVLGAGCAQANRTPVT